MQTRNTAKNTFGEGIIMDFAPDNTQSNLLTNALNATLITYNGNEMSLQNDMGNCRVESAYLPKGYIPVGTCEFGDIIYIVSYNPLENKSQIGCFPSPERNISSKEVSPLVQSISASELAENGKINSTSIKKIIFGSSPINAGDKFIISWGNQGSSNKNYISNYGNTNHNLKNVEQYWPKLTNIHVVSINDFGVITNLDSDVKWYDNDYIISEEEFNQNPDDDRTNIDQYRHALQCQYSVFLSKVSGKLALLIELESIKNFSCGHKVFSRTKNDEQYYDVYFAAYWETDNFNINPTGMLITDVKIDGMTAYDKSEHNKLINPTKSIDDMIEFSRIYKLEDDIETYEQFLNQSYYNNYKKYTTLFSKDSVFIKPIDESEQIITSISKIYSIQNGIYAPYDGNNNESYYIPSFFSTIKKNNGKITYIGTINNFEYECEPQTISDDVIVNNFHKQVLKKIASVKKNSEGNHTITYTVCPCMPYGPLKALAITNTIDFDMPSGKPELTTWKYYVSDNSVTLNFGINPKLNDDTEIIDKILIEFYDNQGICATYKLDNQETYTGKFTEYFNLNQDSGNFRMLNTYIPKDDMSNEPTEQIMHASGDVMIKLSEINQEDHYKYVYYDKDSESYKSVENAGLQGETIVNLNDAGILYSGRPYLTKIKIFKANQADGFISYDNTGPAAVYYRWLWTAPLFNEELNGIHEDFKDCQLKEVIDMDITLDGRNLIKESFNYYKKSLSVESNDYERLGAQVDKVSGTIICKGFPELSNTCGNSILLNRSKNLINKIAVKMGIASNNIEINNEKDITTLYENDYNGEIDSLKPIKSENYSVDKFGPDLRNLLNLKQDSTYPDIYDNKDAYDNYKDMFKLTLKNLNTSSITKVTYQNSKGEFIEKEVLLYDSPDLFPDSNGVSLKMDGIKFNKVTSSDLKHLDTVTIVESLISTPESLNNYNVFINEGIPYFKSLYYLGYCNRKENAPTEAFGRMYYYNDETNSSCVNSPYMIVKGARKESDTDQISLESDEMKECFGSLYPTFPFAQILFGRDRYGYAENYEDGRGTFLNIDASELIKKMGVESGLEKTQVVASPGVKINEFKNDYSILNPVFCKKERSDRPRQHSQNLYSTMLIVSNDIMYGTADAAVLEIKTNGHLNQTFTWKSSHKNYYELSQIKTYAHALCSMLAQLYVVKTEVPFDKTLRKGITKLSDHTETWKSDLIIQTLPDLREPTSKYINLNILIQNDKGDQGLINLNDYANCILNKAEIDDDSDLNLNINPEISPNLRCIEVVYDLPYQSNTISEAYETSNTSTYLKKTVFDDDSIEVEYVPINGSYYDDHKLYVYIGGNAITQFLSGYDFKVVNEFKSNNGNLIAKISNYSLQWVPYSGITDALKYNGSFVEIEDIKKLRKNNITYDVTIKIKGDENQTTPGLKLINLFNYGKFL